jgi:hypothetical protein
MIHPRIVEQEPGLDCGTNIATRRRMLPSQGIVLTVAIALTSTIAANPAGPCRVEGERATVAETPELSGIAASRNIPGRLWVHNDSGEPVLVAIDVRGRVQQRVRVAGASVRDWEDLAVAACGSQSCIYIADIGDNRASRPDVVIYRVPEPAAADTVTAPAEAIRAVYPDGPHNAEAFFVTPSGEMFVVTKEKAAAVYRIPAAENGAPARMQKIKTLTGFAEKITGAASTPDGRRVALRTHTQLAVFTAADLVSPRQTNPTIVDLSGLGERQGEGVAFGEGGTVFLVGEGGGGRRAGTLSRLACTW